MMVNKKKTAAYIPNADEVYTGPDNERFVQLLAETIMEKELAAEAIAKQGHNVRGNTFVGATERALVAIPDPTFVTVDQMLALASALDGIPMRHRMGALPELIRSVLA